MANVQSNINRLLYALKLKGEFYKINSFQFFSEYAGKYKTKYQVSKREVWKEENETTGEIETYESYSLVFDCYSKVDLMKYLADEYKSKLKEGENNG